MKSKLHSMSRVIISMENSRLLSRIRQSLMMFSLHSDFLKIRLVMEQQMNVVLQPVSPLYSKELEHGGIFKGGGPPFPPSG